MRSDASNKDQVQIAAAKVRDALSDPRLQDVVQQAATQVPGEADPKDKIAGLLSGDADELASSGNQAAGVPYLSRAPLVSMIQSRSEEALNEAGVPDPGKPASL